MSDFARLSKTLVKGLAIMLTLYSEVLIAQAEPTSPALVVQRAPKYDLPQALPNFGVSSDEFEHQIGLRSQTAQTSQIPASQGAANSYQNPSLLKEEAFPVGIASPFPGHGATTPLAETLPDYSRVATQQTIPWWQERCTNSILTNEPNKACPVDLEQLIWQSMQYSAKVQSILIAPKIQRTDIQIARGEFDRRRFSQTNYHSTSDPVGNVLTTGGPNRLNEQFWENSIGVRDLNTRGGKSELSQMIIGRDSNSLFFKPNNQADSKLSLNYTQPLMRGSGVSYNTSSIQLAGIKTNQSIATANRELQNHAMDVVNAFWEMVLHRYLMEQARKGHERLQQIKAQLLNREGRDLISTHVSRANAAIANQKSQILTARNNILAQQQTLRRLVNSPDLDQQNCDEIVPLTMPTTDLPIFPLEEELVSALNHRGDIIAIQQTIQTAQVQRNLALNELRPQLDLVTSSYVRGLRGDNQFAQSFANQFDTGRPSFATGLTYLNPVRNRTAKANLTSRELEIAKLRFDYADELNKVRAEIITAILSAQATYETTLAAIEGTFASRDEVDGHKVRFEDFYADNPPPSNILNDLLDAENRLIAAENSWATKQVQHMIALFKIKYESGTLMAITAE